MNREMFDENTYRDDFESMLKEQADSFILYPSSKVWRGIYNHIHPGRKWPSALVCLLMFFILMYSGFEPSRIRETFLTTAVPEKNQYYADVASSVGGEKNVWVAPSIRETTDKTEYSRYRTGKLKGLGYKEIKKEFIIEQRLDSVKQRLEMNMNGISSSLHNQLSNDVTPKVTREVTKEKPEIRFGMSFLLANLRQAEKTNNRQRISASGNKESSSKLSYQIYATPAFTFTYSTEPINLDNANQPAGTNRLGRLFHQLSNFNFEAGGNIIYSLTDAIKMKAGVQFNYSSAQGNDDLGLLKGNSLTDIMSTSASEHQIISTNANINGQPLYLNNETYQISIPLGANFKLAGRDALEWYVGTTLQPTFVIPGTSSVLLDDALKSAFDNANIRTWNVNGGLEMFITYKINNKVLLNAGPQLRYQMLSTYQKDNNYYERPYNLGLKLGLTSAF